MSTLMTSILLIGGTSGLGEGFLRRFHAQGKKVIVTGRREERLAQLKSELPGVETYRWDTTDIASLGKHAEAILAAHPDIDTVFYNAGIMKTFSYLDPTSVSPARIEAEVTTNVTAPFVLAHTFIPHLAKIAESDRPANFLITSSGLAFNPMGLFPAYCATKSAVHSFLLALRQQINKGSEKVQKNLSITEIVPPAVESDLLNEDAHKLGKMPKLTQEEYFAETMAGLAEFEDGKLKKEVAAGSAATRVGVWRGSMGKMMADMGLIC